MCQTSPASSSTRSSLPSSPRTIIRMDMVTGTVMDMAAMAMDTVMVRRSRISALVLFLWENQG